MLYENYPGAPAATYENYPRETLTYFQFSQNNSGGRWVVDEAAGISSEVFIEAHDEAEARILAISKGLYFNGVDAGRDCACCGDRWYGGSPVEVREVPEKGEPPRDSFIKTFIKEGSAAYVHPLEGSFYGAW